MEEKMKKTTFRVKDFTLIELLVDIAIIAIHQRFDQQELHSLAFLIHCFSFGHAFLLLIF